MLKSNRLFRCSVFFGVMLSLLTACAPSIDQQVLSPEADLDSGIIGGTAAKADEELAQSTVAIGTEFSGNFCTGVLVAKNLVLTAAHCSGVVRDPQMMQIIFGADLSKKSKLQFRKVLGGEVPEAWPKLTESVTKNEGDIALLKFEGEIPEGFKPMPMLASSKQLKKGMEATLMGYGLTSMRPERDPLKLMKAKVQLSEPDFAETEIAFAQFEGRGACHGDSGGPAYVTIDKKNYVIGVTSRSITESGGQTCLEGSVYTSVPGQIDFLKKASQFLNSNKFVPGKPIPQPKFDL